VLLAAAYRDLGHGDPDRPGLLGRLGLPAGWVSWLRSAVAEEELELLEAIRPRPATRRDAFAYRDRGLGRPVGVLIVAAYLAFTAALLAPAAAPWLAGATAIGLAMVLGIPDGIWGTATHLAFLAAVTVVALAATLAAAIIGRLSPS
jgi:hypothetical protein